MAGGGTGGGRSGGPGAEAVPVAGLPDFIELERHRDRQGLPVRPWSRWIGLSLVFALVVAAALNVFGQRPAGSAASGGGATLQVSAPTALRGGLFYQGRFRITAERELRHATIVLDRGWLEQMHINTIEPAPVGEASRDGRLALDFGRVAPGATLVAYLQFQVNPAQTARRSQDVVLADGERVLARVERTVTVFP